MRGCGRRGGAQAMLQDAMERIRGPTGGAEPGCTSSIEAIEGTRAADRPHTVGGPAHATRNRRQRRIMGSPPPLQRWRVRSCPTVQKEFPGKNRDPAAADGGGGGRGGGFGAKPSHCCPPGSWRCPSTSRHSRRPKPLCWPTVSGSLWWRVVASALSGSTMQYSSAQGASTLPHWSAPQLYGSANSGGDLTSLGLHAIDSSCHSLPFAWGRTIPCTTGTCPAVHCSHNPRLCQ